MANQGSCYIKSCWVMILQSVNSNIYQRVHAQGCVCVCVWLKASAAHLLGLDQQCLWTLYPIQTSSCAEQKHMVEQKKKKEFFFPLCHRFTEGPYTPSAPRKAVPSPSCSQHFAPVSAVSSVMALAVFIIWHMNIDALGGTLSRKQFSLS